MRYIESSIFFFRCLDASKLSRHVFQSPTTVFHPNFSIKFSVVESTVIYIRLQLRRLQRDAPVVLTLSHRNSYCHSLVQYSLVKYWLLHIAGWLVPVA